MKRYSLPIILASTLLAQAASAQSSSSTDPIGYYKFDVPAGTTAWNCAFVTKKDFQGAMTSITPGAVTSVINQTGATFGSLTSHFVEILSGPNTGLILDIVSGAYTNSVTVNGDLGPSGFNLAGTETYCIRKHATLSTVFAGGAGVAPIDDTVEIFDDAGGSVLAAWDGVQWVDAVDFVTPVNPLIYPGQGFKISSLAGGTITFGGNEVSYVKSGPTKVAIYSGVVNLVGVLNPLVSTTPALPADQAMLSQLGFNTLAPVDDIITAFTTDGTLIESIYAHDGTNVVDGVDLVTIKNTDTIRNGQSFQLSPLSNGIYTQPQLIP